MRGWCGDGDGLWTPCHSLARSKAERRSVQLGACPVQFALYLKLRCDMEYDMWKNFEEHLKKYNDHIEECWMDGMMKNGTDAISASFMMSNVYSIHHKVRYDLRWKKLST